MPLATKTVGIKPELSYLGAKEPTNVVTFFSYDIWPIFSFDIDGTLLIVDTSTPVSVVQKIW